MLLHFALPFLHLLQLDLVLLQLLELRLVLIPLDFQRLQLLLKVTDLSTEILLLLQHQAKS